MKYPTPFLWLLLFFIVFSSCGPSDQPSGSPDETTPDPYLHIQDLGVKRVLQAAIEKAGGLQNWKALESLQFQKNFTLLTATGETESTAQQTHTYTFRPKEKVLIEWAAEKSTHAIIYEEGKAIKTIDGTRDTTANPQSLLNTVLSSTFVISIPFKLLDDGVQLFYEGLDTLEDKRVVEVIRAVYNPDNNANHSTPDTWWHYYDAQDFTFLAYMVQHIDHFSYVKNLSFHTLDGFAFPHKRKSYRADSLRNILYLRADYEYMGYSSNAG